MHARFEPLVALLLIVPVAGAACSTRFNYLAVEGPRYEADHVAARAEGFPPSARDSRIRVVTYNVKYGREVETAIEELGSEPELRDADVLLLQEMDPEGVDRIARALGYRYVYYPATLRTSGREFGNAVLTRGRFLEDEKVLLPHRNPINGQGRLAVRTLLEVEGAQLEVLSVHTETPFLGDPGRVAQLRAILDATGGETPCIVGGDFNTLSTRTRRLFASEFASAGFEHASRGSGSTHRVGPIRFTLDHVFSRGLELVGCGVVTDAEASDHLPLWVELALAAPSFDPES